MKTRSILYSRQMILAKVKGWKTVTRRPVKPQPVKAEKQRVKKDDCPFGIAGDRLYVKENFQIVERNDFEQAVKVKYKADGEARWVQLTDAEFEKCREWKQPFGKKSSLFMFKSISRFVDEITEIDMEKVQDITRQEVFNEGLYREFDENSFWFKDYRNPKKMTKNAINAFKSLWQNMYEGGEFDWHQNPWVWVVRFEPVSEMQGVRRKKQEVKSEK